MTLTAIPTQGWSFESWSGGPISGAENPIEGQFISEDSVEARFVEIEKFPLIATIVSHGAGIGGVVSLEPDKPGYLAGEVVRVLASPAVGWRFDGWSEDLSGTALIEQIVVEKPTQITAAFTQEGFELKTQIEGAGSGSISMTPDQPFYVYGQEVRVAAEADEGSVFEGWAEYRDAPSTFTLTIRESGTLTARFGLLGGEAVHSLEVITGGTGSGTVQVLPQKPLYATGAEVTLEAIPAPDSTFGGWGGDLSGNENPATIRLESTISIQAVFKKLGDFELFLPTVRR